ncbi:MAG: glycosyltransferase [Pseudomonadota bacterium]
MTRRGHARVLMYSHDTFGLGHLRRCRAIAHALVERYSGILVLIISGSPIAGAFDFRARVDFVKVPSVIKLHNGDYTSLDRHIDLSETLEMRRTMIHHLAESFDPDLLVVDKEAMGLRGELLSTLRMLKDRGTTLVLGLREVMDAPDRLQSEWQRANMITHIDELYDHLWVYGPEDFWDPLTDLDVPASLRDRMTYTGYLDRTTKQAPTLAGQHLPEDYILVSAGGGGDGAPLMHQVMAALEHDRSLTIPTVMLLGPFMKTGEREQIHARAASFPEVTVIDFDNRAEAIMQQATAVVSMCGYNTFCEILSYDKRALIVPRTHPRREQELRAVRAAELGIVDVLLPKEAEDPATMASTLHALRKRPRPSESGNTLSLDGLDVICDLVGDHFARERSQEQQAVQLVARTA